MRTSFTGRTVAARWATSWKSSPPEISAESIAKQFYSITDERANALVKDDSAGTPLTFLRWEHNIDEEDARWYRCETLAPVSALPEAIITRRRKRGQIQRENTTEAHTELIFYCAAGYSVCMVPVLLTHWVPGFLLHGALVVLWIGGLIFAVSIWIIYFAAVHLIPRCRLRMRYRIVVTAILRLAGAVLFDAAFITMIRYPILLATMMYGTADYPYAGLGVQDRHHYSTAGHVHSFFYLLQMASPQCYAVNAFANSVRGLNTVLSIIN